jgi:8-oxo-dGTP pyrophosphatase MutT (NUDIX family)
VTGPSGARLPAHGLPATAPSGARPPAPGSRLRLRPVADPGPAAPGNVAVARAHVRAARPGHPSHEANRRRTLDLLRRHPDALGRSCGAAHVTGSAMVVDPVSRRFLLMLHALLGLWLQPGGHADGDGALPGVAWREASEETGIAGLAVATPAIDVDIHLVPPPHGPVLHLDVRYLVVAPPGAVPRANQESRGLRWVAYDQLVAYGADPGLIRLADAALAGLDELEATGQLGRRGRVTRRRA